MGVSESIREAIPIARIKGSHECPCREGRRVVVFALALTDRVAIAVQEGAQYRAGTKEEVEQAGYSYQGHVMVTISDEMVSCAMVLVT